jgi:class 3 adenylate cyclase
MKYREFALAFRLHKIAAVDSRTASPEHGSFDPRRSYREMTMEAPLSGATPDSPGSGPCSPGSAPNGYHPGTLFRPRLDPSAQESTAVSLRLRVTKPGFSGVIFHNRPQADSRTMGTDAIELADCDQAVLDGEVVDVSVLFADLRGFTAASEQLAPRRMAGLLNNYLTAMVDVILARQGMVQDFVGDGILAVFGAPSRDPDHAWHAAVTAVEMQAALEFLRRRLEAEGPIRLAMGISVHSGEVFAGTVGSPRQAKYAAVGDTVNAASRLEELNRELGTSIVMSGETIALLINRVEVRSRGWFPVRGRSHPLEVFELLGLRR